MAKSAAVPLPALLLGISGLLPFLASVIAIFLDDGLYDEMARIALVGYGAVILSFLGGIRWGVVLKERSKTKMSTPLLLSIVPSLIAWCALLVNSILGTLILILGFGGQYLYDRASSNQGQLPRWYGRLRLWLSSAVLLLLAAGLILMML